MNPPSITVGCSPHSQCEESKNSKQTYFWVSKANNSISFQHNCRLCNLELLIAVPFRPDLNEPALDYRITIRNTLLIPGRKISRTQDLNSRLEPDYRLGYISAVSRAGPWKSISRMIRMCECRVSLQYIFSYIWKQIKKPTYILAYYVCKGLMGHKWVRKGEIWLSTSFGSKVTSTEVWAQRSN